MLCVHALPCAHVSQLLYGVRSCGWLLVSHLAQDAMFCMHVLPCAHVAQLLLCACSARSCACRMPMGKPACCAHACPQFACSMLDMHAHTCRSSDAWGMHEIWQAHPDKPIGLIRACEPHTASSRRDAPCETPPTMILQTHSGDSGRLLPTLERRSSRLCGSPFSREIQGGLCLPWLDGDWCFRVAPRNAFTRALMRAFGPTL
jgi:hypothetical protein